MHRNQTPPQTRTLGALLLTLALLGEQVVAGGPVVRLDRRIETFLVPHRANWGVQLARHVTDLGNPTVVVPLLVVLAAVVGAWRRDWRLPLRVVALTVALGLSVTVLKHAVGRPAPHGAMAHGGAWPSGHTTTATVVWGAAVRTLGLPGRQGHRGRQGHTGRQGPSGWARLALGVGIPLAVGPCLVLAGYHQASDVVAGWVLGAVLLLLSDRAAGGWVSAPAPRRTADRSSPASGRPSGSW